MNTPARICAQLIAFIIAAVLSCGIKAADDAAGATPPFADEDKDWNVAPVTEVRRTQYHAPTPREVPGARAVSTVELKALLEKDSKPFLVDVLSGPAHRTLLGAIWMNNGGLGDFDKDEEKRFVDTLAMFSGGDKAKPMVFFCSGAECWLSYNASLRAVAAGYKNVMWYRGGIESWKKAGLPVSDPTRNERR